MARTKRTLVAAGLTAAVALAVVLVAGGCADPIGLRANWHEAAASCRGSMVELDFDPEGHIEARAGGKTVASADVVSRRVSYDACAKRPMPRGFYQGGVRYARLKSRATLTAASRAGSASSSIPSHLRGRASDQPEATSAWCSGAASGRGRDRSERSSLLRPC
jgi:hypothetical protein